jgi:hypothetical protein
MRLHMFDRVGLLLLLAFLSSTFDVQNHRQSSTLSSNPFFKNLGLRLESDSYSDTWNILITKETLPTRRRLNFRFDKLLRQFYD